MATNPTLALGNHSLWGLTPALDLLDTRTTGLHPTCEQQHEETKEKQVTDGKKESADAESAKSTAKHSTSPGTSAAAQLLAKLSLSSSASSFLVAAQAAAAARKAYATLIVQGGDILTIFKTIIKSRTHDEVLKGKECHIYLLDDNASSIARHLLLLSIACDTSLSLRGRTELFLEVYGNTFIQEKTQMYINRRVKLIRQYLSTLATLSTPSPPSSSALSFQLFRNLVDLSHLKLKELDAVESALEFATTPNTKPSSATTSSTQTKKDPTNKEKEKEEETKTMGKIGMDALVAEKGTNAFDIENLRDHRLRGYFGDRYDARANLVDWDYHMRLKSVASIIHTVHYKKWRLTGIAFEERLCTYPLPNRTFASYREANSKTRGSVIVRGFWGDTLVSPYVTLGVEANDKRLFAMRNRQHVKTAHHVCEYNLLSLLYELESGRPYALPATAKKKKSASSSSSSSSSSGKQDEEEIVNMPDEIILEGDEEQDEDGPSSQPIEIVTPAAAASSSNSSSAASSSSSSSSSSLPAALCHTTNRALSLDKCKIIFLHGNVNSLANKSRYHSLFNRVFLSQFQVGCINEAVAAQALKEAKQSVDGKQNTTSTTNNAATSATVATTNPADLPLNKLLKPHAVISVESVKFLPVSAAVQSSFIDRVRSLASSAGWMSANPPQSAWSHGAAHSWTDREPEHDQEVEEKKQALTQPAVLNFVWNATCNQASQS